MASTAKPWKLEESETSQAFEAWRVTITHYLSQTKEFADFLRTGKTWTAAASDDTRGISDEKARESLSLFLGVIGSYVPVCVHDDVVQESTSLEGIWSTLRKFYKITPDECNLLDLFSKLKYVPGERPELLYRRIRAELRMNCLKKNSSVKFKGEAMKEDEKMTPLLERLAVLLWLKTIHPELPSVVKIRFSVELQSRSLFDLQEDIDRALPSLLEEIETRAAVADMTHVGRTWVSKEPRTKQRSYPGGRSCELCSAAGRINIAHTHDITKCKFLSWQSKKKFGQAGGVQADEEEATDDEGEGETIRAVQVDRVTTSPSPRITVIHGATALMVTLDSGANAAMIRESDARKSGMRIVPVTQGATQADGKTALEVVGEVNAILHRGSLRLELKALVVRNLDCSILAGTTFLTTNKIVLDFSKSQVFIQSQRFVNFTNLVECPSDLSNQRVYNEARTCYSVVTPLQSDIILPNQTLTIKLPAWSQGQKVAIEPRSESKVNWPQPFEHQVPESGEITLRNNTDCPIDVKNTRPLIQILSTKAADESISPKASKEEGSESRHVQPIDLSKIKMDRDILGPQWYEAFAQVHYDYRDVFDPNIGLYNDASGEFRVRLSLGSNLPAPNRGRVPNYSQEKLSVLQAQMDDLVAQGVLKRPEELGIVPEHVSMSFLVKKPAEGWRLVTAFDSLNQNVKPLPSKLPQMEEILYAAAKWKYVVKTDLTSSFFQLPMHPSAYKYLATVSPFKGTFVYVRAAMGLRNMSEWLDELLALILGDMVAEGRAARIADDLIVGGNTIKECFENWREILARLEKNGLRLSMKKTEICPKSCHMLGWIWRDGELQADPHRTSPLAACEPPQTVSALRSYLGAFKVLSRCIPNYSKLLGPLERMVAGRESKEKLDWSTETISTFKESQKAVSQPSPVIVPRRSDHLTIVMDAAQGSSKVRGGIGATLFVERAEEFHLGGFFSVPFRGAQHKWLPCECEALAIKLAVQHWRHFIRNSDHTTQLHTDSRPCVQAAEKLKSGAFSASARVSSFLTTISNENVCLTHISGNSNGAADFCSRSPVDCGHPERCQVCKFLSETDREIVLATQVNVKDITLGVSASPFTNRPSWRSAQQESSSMRRLFAHLTQGTRPSRKEKDLKEVRQLLRRARVAHDGLLVVESRSPRPLPQELIVVPHEMLPGLLTALHIRLQHPSKHQLKLVFNRHFFAHNFQQVIDAVTAMCSECLSLRKFPRTFVEQTTSEAPTCPFRKMSVDVMRRYGQKIMIIRDSFSSFTMATFIKSEGKEDMRNGIISLIGQMVPSDGCEVKSDNASSFKALKGDTVLKSLGIVINLGEPKNKDSNTVVDKAIQEVELELLKCHPLGGPVELSVLSQVIRGINHRIRNRNYSASEVLFRREQSSGQALQESDEALVRKQNELRKLNHRYSSRAKARGRSPSVLPAFRCGDLVCIPLEGDKNQARPMYLVTGVLDDQLVIQKIDQGNLRSRPYRIRKDKVMLAPRSELLRHQLEERAMHGDLSEGDLSDGGTNEEEDDTTQSDSSTETIVPRRSVRDRERVGRKFDSLNEGYMERVLGDTGRGASRGTAPQPVFNHVMYSSESKGNS